MAAVLALGGGARLASVVGLLTTQPLEVVEPLLGERSLLQGGTHRASRLAVVRAVPEAALLRQREEVRERLAEPLLFSPQPEFAHAGPVDEQPAMRQHEQLPVRGGVAALVVLGPYLLGGQTRLTEQLVDEGGFAHARGAEQRPRPSRREMGAQCLEALSRVGTQGEDGHSRRE